MGEVADAEADDIGALPPGAAIGGYTVRRMLGHGGFGITYEAHNSVTGKHVAIKEFFPSSMVKRDNASRLTYAKANAETITWALRKFQETTTTLCGLSHPHIVQVHDYLPANDTGYMVMELLDGQTLGSWLAARSAPLGLDELWPLLDPVMEALTYVHGRGLIHRDIAPDNIVITREGRPVLIDFGSVSRDLGDARQQAMSSTVGMKKRHYTAPEQMLAKARPTAKADVYSMGAVLYRALTGIEPDDGLDRVLNKADPLKPLMSTRPAGCPTRAAQAIDKALAVAPEKRLEAIAELREAVRPPPPSLPQARPRTTRTLLIAGVAIAALAAAGGVIAGRSWPMGDDAAGRDQQMQAIRAERQQVEAARAEVDGQRRSLNARKAELDEQMLQVEAEKATNDTRKSELQKQHEEIVAGKIDNDARNQDIGRQTEAAKQQAVLTVKAELAKRLLILGASYANGQGVVQNYGTARVLFDTSANLGNNLAIFWLGYLYNYGLGVKIDYTKAREYFEKGASGGDAGAMYYLGMLYDEGDGVTQDYVKARELYEKAMAAGNIKSINSLGDLYYNGDGVTQDYARARALYERAAAAGNDAAMNSLGVLYEDGVGVPQDYAKARGFFERSAAAGNVDANNNLGDIYDGGLGVPQNYARAREFYEKAANAGNDDAANSLGDLYSNGNGVTKDSKKALALYEKAAAAGNDTALNNIGVLYDNGDGVPQDYVKAREWYEKAAAAGNAAANDNLGVLYENGRGVPRDYAKARALYEKAADKGDSDAMNNLGYIYYDARGVSQDYIKARMWYEKAASAGVDDAMYNLGIIYDDGLGVKKDRHKAREWYERAAAAGNADAKAVLREK